MIQSGRSRYWKLGMVSYLVMGGAISSLGDCALAQIIPDTTLGNENSTVTSTGALDQIDGGATRGANLFHSFQEFNIGNGRSALFNNPPGIENILSRVTGANPSNILGTLGVSGGNANLFLINPNGIIFGPNASLDIRGSFLASTASRLNFADGTQFSATTPQATPLLTVSVPIGLQFGTATGSIRNQSRATNSGVVVGLQVQPGKTLALVGGDVTLEGGYVTAEKGRIELGSVAGLSLVSLIPTNQGLVLRYEGIQNFQDIQLSQSAIVSANGSGTIQVQGRRVMLTDESQIVVTNQEAKPGANLTVTASESVELIGDATGLTSATVGAENGGDITIKTGRLLIRDNAFVGTASADYQDSSGQVTPATGYGGNLIVEASESVELRNGFMGSGTAGTGDAGDITIKTGRLLVDGEVGAVTLSSEGTGDAGAAGELTVTARSILLDNQGVLLAEAASGEGGNITLQAGDVRLRRESNISTTAGTPTNPGNGGKITINTDTLVGLENSDITANAFEGKGGTINITAQGIFGLVQRDLEDLKTLLGIDSPIGLDPQRLPSSDITAISQTDPSLRGQVIINRPDVDPSQGLVNLPEEVVDVSGLVAQGCSADGGKADRGSSEFIVTGRGGLPPTPRETLNSDTVLEDWGNPALTSAQPLRPRQHDARENRSGSPAVSTHPTRPMPAHLVEANGWVIGAKGEVILTATAPTTTPHSPWLPPATCHAP